MHNNHKRPDDLTTVDLFSGCGGMSLGFQNAGFNVVAAYDNWELANTVYEENFDHDVHWFDLSDTDRAVEHVAKYAPTVVIGGPPCQDFSIAGKRQEAHRANLTIAFARIASRVAARVVVMENVYNIEKSKSLSEAIGILRDCGYGLTTRVIDASLVGVPQRRKRFFLVGAKGVPEEAFGRSLDAGLADRPMTIHDHFGDELGIKHYYAHPRSYNRRAVFSVHEPSSTIRRVNRPIPKDYKRHPADKAAISKSVRPLTTEERSKVQTFPSDYIFCGSKSQREHLIANAVPPKLAQYVAERALEALRTDPLFRPSSD